MSRKRAGIGTVAMRDARPGVSAFDRSVLPYFYFTCKPHYSPSERHRANPRGRLDLRS